MPTVVEMLLTGMVPFSITAKAYDYAYHKAIQKREQNILMANTDQQRWMYEHSNHATKTWIASLKEKSTNHRELLDTLLEI